MSTAINQTAPRSPPSTHKRPPLPPRPTTAATPSIPISGPSTPTKTNSQNSNLNISTLSPDQIPLTVVIKIGSYSIQHGIPTQFTPSQILTRVAFPNKSNSKKRNYFDIHSDENNVPMIDRTLSEDCTHALTSIVNEEALEERRRGHSKPVIWKEDIEVIQNHKGSYKNNAVSLDNQKSNDPPKQTVIGAALDRDWDRDGYSIVEPIYGGRLTVDIYGIGMVRSALTCLFEEIIGCYCNGSSTEQQLAKVVVVVPEECTRWEVCELLKIVFDIKAVQFVTLHHASVSAAIGSGVTSCVVVDIGHTAGFVTCIDEGMVLPESRIALPIGGAMVSRAFAVLLACKSSVLLKSDLSMKQLESLCESHIKHELATVNTNNNDVLGVVTVSIRNGSGTDEKLTEMKLSLGNGFCAIPALGLLYPHHCRELWKSWLHPNHTIFHAGSIDYLRNWHQHCQSMGPSKAFHGKSSYYRGGYCNDDLESAYFDSIIDDSTVRGARAVSKQITGYFAHAVTAAVSPFVMNCQSGTVSGTAMVCDSDGEAHGDDGFWMKMKSGVGSVIDGAVMKSVMLAIEGKGTGSAANELKKRIWNTVLAVGGSAMIEGIGERIEEGLVERRELAERGTLEVVVGGRDVPAWMVQWKGGAVLAQCETIGELWISKDEFRERGSTVVRERSLFFW